MKSLNHNWDIEDIFLKNEMIYKSSDRPISPSIQGVGRQPVWVFIADENEHFRRVISQELMSDPRTLLINQAANYKEACKKICTHSFDVLIVDSSFGGERGMNLMDFAKEKHPRSLTIIMSSSEEYEAALASFRRGAAGYLVKDSWFGTYSQAALDVANGGAVVSPIVAKKIILKLMENKFPEQYDSSKLHEFHLTQREIEVLKMVSIGKNSLEIGRELKISSMTVSTHVKNIYRKMKVKSRAQAVRYAILKGFV